MSGFIAVGTPAGRGGRPEGGKRGNLTTGRNPPYHKFPSSSEEQSAQVNNRLQRAHLDPQPTAFDFTTGFVPFEKWLRLSHESTLEVEPYESLAATTRLDLMESAGPIDMGIRTELDPFFIAAPPTNTDPSTYAEFADTPHAQGAYPFEEDKIPSTIVDGEKIRSPTFGHALAYPKVVFVSVPSGVSVYNADHPVSTPAHRNIAGGDRVWEEGVVNSSFRFGWPHDLREALLAMNGATEHANSTVGAYERSSLLLLAKLYRRVAPFLYDPMAAFVLEFADTQPRILEEEFNEKGYPGYIKTIRDLRGCQSHLPLMFPQNGDGSPISLYLASLRAIAYHPPGSSGHRLGWAADCSMRVPSSLALGGAIFEAIRPVLLQGRSAREPDAVMDDNFRRVFAACCLDPSLLVEQFSLANDYREQRGDFKLQAYNADAVPLLHRLVVSPRSAFDTSTIINHFHRCRLTPDLFWKAHLFGVAVLRAIYNDNTPGSFDFAKYLEERRQSYYRHLRKTAASLEPPAEVAGWIVLQDKDLENAMAVMEAEMDSAHSGRDRYDRSPMLWWRYGEMPWDTSEIVPGVIAAWEGAQPVPDTSTSQPPSEDTHMDDGPAPAESNSGMVIAVNVYALRFSSRERRGSSLVGGSITFFRPILLQRQVVELTRNGHPSRLYCINKLVRSLAIRFELEGNSADIDEAVTLLRTAAEDIPDGQGDQAAIFTELGNALITRFAHQVAIGDLEEALTLHRCAVEIVLDDPILQARYLSNLGSAFLAGFKAVSELSYLEDAIAAQREAVEIMPQTENDGVASVVDTLGTSLLARFDRQGELRDLEEAITLHTRGVEALPDTNASKPRHLNNLGNSYLTRFKRLGELDDLQKAISLLHRAVDLTPKSSQTGILGSLGNLYLARYHAKGNASDLDQAILYQQRSVDATPSAHPDRAGRLVNLGSSYATRYHSQGRPEDFEEAIALQKSAIEVTPDDNPHKLGRLNNLGVSLLARFDQSGNPKDIEDTISIQEKAVGLTPQGHFERPRILRLLGICYHAQLQSSSQPSEPSFLSASEALREAAHTSGPLTTQFDAATRLRTLYEEFPQFCGPSHNTLDVHQRVVDLLPQVAWVGLSVSRRYEELAEQIGDAVGAATAAALDANDFERALEWFEGGRAVVWNQTLNLRTPLDDLRQAHPKLAERIQEISVKLEQGGTSGDMLPTEEQARDHRLLADQYDKLVDEVRQLPGFNSFLRSRQTHDLYPAASGGPVVCINMHKSRCDALILCSGSVFHVPLPKLSPSIAESMRDKWGRYLGSLGVRNRNYRAGVARDWDDEDSGETLVELWDTVVQPILEFIHEKISLATDKTTSGLPHITWCTTGALAFLPLHAAGRYEDGVEGNAFDSTISSYAPTLASLLVTPRVSDNAVPPRIAIVAQPDTPYATPLSGTIDEANRLAALFAPSTNRLLIGKDGTTRSVLEAMSEYRWIHLACHGTQNTSNPAQSAFLLHDRPLSLEELMKTTSNVGELAFLSACETATGDEHVPDEAVHLTAGMLAAGYRSVVATMWAIGDGVAPVAAEAFYQTLLQEMDAGRGMSVAYALHEAVKKVRDQVGKENFVEWVPFVHYGL
ncbi:hypothetical protein CYLTODRAFT_443476 [Cylindrobasidium torrendii FP15055 ss-10]|uniref:CHAT domain-containing protein n=1 Tax=Cylindrobasidium torrendii FP15055 ss-10 TaxID=1314674 RepID=A0A0D7BCP2_9AGAR|nr:hypothetical protein CYLTODRAFT_443476 [Cylindrobasidium torrendii FP15055 ss-10]